MLNGCDVEMCRIRSEFWVWLPGMQTIKFMGKRMRFFAMILFTRAKFEIIIFLKNCLNFLISNLFGQFMSSHKTGSEDK